MKTFDECLKSLVDISTAEESQEVLASIFWLLGMGLQISASRIGDVTKPEREDEPCEYPDTEDPDTEDLDIDEVCGSDDRGNEYSSEDLGIVCGCCGNRVYTTQRAEQRSRTNCTGYPKGSENV